MSFWRRERRKGVKRREKSLRFYFAPFFLCAKKPTLHKKQNKTNRSSIRRGRNKDGSYL